jgi:hypothetical protein
MSGVLRAREWEVVPVSHHREVAAFLKELHYSGGAANTSIARHGLYRRDDPLRMYGVAVWMPPTRRAAESVAPGCPNGVLALSRLCVAPEVPTNGASFLLGRSMRMLDRKRWPVLLTYADTREGHTGAIYRATNWTHVGLVPGSDSWVGPDGVQRGRKRGGRNYSADDMRAAGFRRLPSMPKHKFVHVARRAAA